MQDVLIVCCDGFERRTVGCRGDLADFYGTNLHRPFDQSCHGWVSCQDRKPVSSTLRKIYIASNADTAGATLDAYKDSEFGRKYPQSVKVWRDAWERFVPFLQLPPAARKVLHTTNSIESLNAELRKATRNRRQLPNDTAALKTLWLMICSIEDKRAAQPTRKTKHVAITTKLFWCKRNSAQFQGSKISGPIVNLGREVGPRTNWRPVSAL